MPAEENLSAVAVERPEIVDPGNVPVVFADWIITGGTFENVVNLALGTIDHSMKRAGEKMPRIIVATRLRCTREFALQLHDALGGLLGIPKQAAAGSQNGPPATPPNNLIN